MKTLLMFMILTGSYSLFAADKDQVLQIEAMPVAGSYCIVGIEPVGEDNCKENNGQRGQCEGIANCVCIKPDKHIEWQSADIKDYQIYFYGDSPFKPNCNLESNTQGKLKCRIKNDAVQHYDYGVNVAGCEDFDPRIIIK